MKLATLRDGTRDGRLVVVSRDLSVCMPAAVTTLQQALDQWDQAEPLLQQQYQRVNAGAATLAAFDPNACLSPLPRAYQWIDGSAYVNHVALVRKARARFGSLARPSSPARSGWGAPLSTAWAPRR